MCHQRLPFESDAQRHPKQSAGLSEFKRVRQGGRYPVMVEVFTRVADRFAKAEAKNK